MNTGLSLSDYIVFIVYFVIVVSYGFWIYNKKKKAVMDTHDYFLAEGSLTWWAIGASMIASNISAEQFIGMSGEGFFVGMAVASYEWVAAIALIIIAVWFMPIYLKNKIYTMPQFLTQRYNETVALIMAIFWLFLYVLVNLTSILYLGAIAISGLMGPEYFYPILLALAIFSMFITLGGMKVIGYTDVIQVGVLIIGGLATVYMALDMVGVKLGGGGGAIAGFNALMEHAPGHFHMMLPKPEGQVATSEAHQLAIDKYLVLPGLATYAAGTWIVNLNYWGCNQYITQRALGANLQTARTGILFSGLLKLLMPVIVMLPGICAYVLYHNNLLPGFEGKKDGAYSAILAFLPSGLKGLAVAALTAAIVASLAGKLNSISTIFTLDIYKKHLKKEADEKNMVWIGRVTVLVATLVAIFFTWKDTLGIGGEGGFTYIQKYTGFISPGVFAMFLLGMFWKRTTGAAAVAGVLVGFLLSVFFNQYAPAVLGNENILYTAYQNKEGVWEIPFLICMGWSFFFTMLVMIGISLAGPKVNPKAYELDASMFRVNKGTMALIMVTLMLIIALYAKFW
ncbi:sodium/solute symporter [Paraflavisolibacter sp. H34]|uniref:sodium:solute symporter family transporter n=1 Tax=Huijunlia imazamoxiresistens TaxID=3127457 RepID=UPI003018A993